MTTATTAVSAQREPTLHLVSPTGTLGNSPPRTLGEHGSSLWNRVMTEYHIEDVGGRELLALVCQQLDPCGSAKGPDRFRG